MVNVDDIKYGATKEYLTVSLHSGKNRVIRRLFAALDYKVKKLDRINFAGLTKMGVRQGFTRELTALEVKELYNLVKI